MPLEGHRLPPAAGGGGGCSPAFLHAWVTVTAESFNRVKDLGMWAEEAAQNTESISTRPVIPPLKTARLRGPVAACWSPSGDPVTPAMLRHSGGAQDPAAAPGSGAQMALGIFS